MYQYLNAHKSSVKQIKILTIPSATKLCHLCCIHYIQCHKCKLVYVWYTFYEALVYVNGLIYSQNLKECDQDFLWVYTNVFCLFKTNLKVWYCLDCFAGKNVKKLF